MPVLRRRHRGDAARAHQGGGAQAVPRHHPLDPRNEDLCREPCPALRVRQDRASSTWPAGSHELGWELVSSRRHRGGARPRPACPSPTSPTSPAFPPILGHRVVTLHPKIHGGLLADRDDPEHIEPTWPSTASSRIDLVVSNLYPFGSTDARARRDLIDIGGPAMIRAAAKNHAHVGDRHRPGRLRRRARRAAGDGRAERRRPAARLARKAFATHRRVRRRDRRVARRRRAAARARSYIRARAATARRCATARTRTSRPRCYRRRGARRRGGTHVDAARRARALVPQPLRRRRRVAARARPRRPADRAPSSSTPTRAAWPWPTPSPTRTSCAFECDERSAFGGIVALNRPIDDATVERDGRGRAGRRRDRARLRGRRGRRARRQAQEHPPPRGAGADAGPLATSARSPAGFLVQEPHHFAAARERLAGRHRSGSRPTPSVADAELAFRICGAREVELRSCS